MTAECNDNLKTSVGADQSSRKISQANKESEQNDITERLKFVGTQFIQTSQLTPSKYQTRHRAFDQTDDIQSLAESIQSVGLMELPSVRKISGNPGAFEIITGHRRIRAVVQHLGWKKVKCEVYENVDELTAFRLAITENIQRSNLSPYEEGTSYLMCHKLFGLSDSQISEQLHRSRTIVQSRKQLAISADNSLRILDDSEADQFLRNYTTSHYEVLATVEEFSRVAEAVRMIKNGATAKELKSFITEIDEDQSTRVGRTESSPGRLIRARSDRSKLMDQLTDTLQSLKEQAPNELRPKIYLLEDLIDDVISKSKQSQNDVKFNSLPESYREPVKEVVCPNCANPLEIERQVNERESSIMFYIRTKSSDSNPNKSSVVVFPRIL
jgi:ParB family chromosome partitioning protein